MKTFNEFETAVEKARSGALTMQALLRQMMDADLALPSATEVMRDGTGFQPLLFPKENAQMLACFTDKSRLAEYISLAPYCLVMKGRELLSRVPPGYGLVVNPGTSSLGFDVSPEGVTKIREDFA